METADMVIRNAKIYTVDEKNPWAQAVAIRGEKVLGVGDSDEMQRFVGPMTNVIDAGGGFVMPGFFDAHCHPSFYTHRMGAANVFSCQALEEYQQAIVEFARRHEKAEVIRGVGWFHADFGPGGPRKEMLDSLELNYPVLVYSGDLHSLWVNSKALEKAGITKATPDPPGGSIGRDEAGHPSGFLNEIPAMRLVEKCFPAFSPEEYAEGITAFFQVANGVGITSVHDAGVFDPVAYDGYKLIEDKDFGMRRFMSIVIEEKEGLDISRELSRLALLKEELEASGITVNGIKLFMDGVAEANTALLEAPYLTEPFETSPQWNRRDFDAICLEADSLGYQIHIHCIGDRAVRQSIDALTAAQGDCSYRDRRHLLAHLQLVNQSDYKRMKENCLVAVLTPFWFEKYDLYYQIEQFNLGRERADREFPMKSFLDAGVHVACGSDAPVETEVPVVEVAFNPLLAIQMAITRCRAGKDSSLQENVLNPGERITLAQAIRSYTWEPAYANYVENEQGSIEVGKWADVIFLDTNLFEISSEQIHCAKVIRTISGGRIVYEAEEGASASLDGEN